MPSRRDEAEPPKRRIQIFIAQDLFEELRQSARTNNRSINGEVITAVQEYLRRRRPDVGPDVSRDEKR